jgi:allophanate hydrolase
MSPQTQPHAVGPQWPAFAAYARIEATARPEVWIDLRPQAEVEEEARAIDTRLAAGEHLPLAGKLFAAKGNIDVAGLPTTAGCPAYAYHPQADAPVVARLRAAGAIALGTTNLDQFATGLVGTRSPHGAVRNAIDPERISGGSSSGSAVAVALGIVDLALGTDTAGSGRIPAAFNGIVGLKPTRGLVPTDGVVPACATLDCVTVFARTLQEAEQALAHMTSPPARDLPRTPPRAPGPWRIAVPPREQLGELDEGWAEAYEEAAAQLRAAGAELRPLDLAPFTEAAAMLYEGAFVAERYTAVGSFVDKLLSEGGAGLDPTVAGIITRARDIPAHQLFADQDRLAALRTRALAELGDADALLLPTAPGHPTLAEVAADPLGANARLGRFTNSTNLFDLAAVAVPAGEVAGLPFGVMLIGPAFTDERLARDRPHPGGADDPDRRGRRPPVGPAAQRPTPLPGRPVGTYDQDRARLPAARPADRTAQAGPRPRGRGRRRDRGRGVAAARRGTRPPARRTAPADGPGPGRTGRRRRRTRLPVRAGRAGRRAGHHGVRRMARVSELPRRVTRLPDVTGRRVPRPPRPGRRTPRPRPDAECRPTSAPATSDPRDDTAAPALDPAGASPTIPAPDPADPLAPHRTIVFRESDRPGGQGR